MVLAAVGAAPMAAPALVRVATLGEHRTWRRGARHREQAGHGDGTCPALESGAVAEALGSLRPDHRSVLVETYFRGRSVAEAAVTLGISEGAVKSRAFDALKALRLALQERGLAP